MSKKLLFGIIMKKLMISRKKTHYATCLKILSTEWSSISRLIHLASEHETKYMEYLKVKVKTG